MLDRSWDIGGGAVDKQVDAAELGDGVLDRHQDSVGVGKISRETEGANVLPSKRSGHPLELRVSSRQEGDIRSGPGKLDCRRPAEAAAGAGHKGDLADKRSSRSHVDRLYLRMTRANDMAQVERKRSRPHRRVRFLPATATNRRGHVWTAGAAFYDRAMTVRGWKECLANQ